MSSSVELKLNKGVISQIDSKIEQQLNEAGEMLESDIKKNTPVDTGRLKDSISYTLNPSDNSITVGSDVEYAPYVEYRESFVKRTSEQDSAKLQKLFENII